MTNGNEPINPNGGAELSGEFKYGLTKREYFAALVMQGYASIDGGGFHLRANARLAVQQADELIAMLNKEVK